MDILVTGCAGYIGSVTCEMLLNEGHNVAGLDNLLTGHRQAVPEGVVFYEADLADREELNEIFSRHRPEAVIHFAGRTLVGESMEKPDLYFRENIDCGLNLLEQMKQTGAKRIVFSSSAATYGQPEETPIVEDTPKNPTNPYGESKLMFERILEWYRRIHGIEFVALRYFNACGASERFGEDHDPETHLIPLVLKTALGQRQFIEIYGDDYPTPDGSCVRDYIHIIDLAQAHLLALREDAAGAYNLGNGDGYSVTEVIQAAERVVGKAINHRVGPRRPGDPAVLVAGSEKIRNQLGWNPKYPELERIIESAWRWHKEHPNGYER